MDNMDIKVAFSLVLLQALDMPEQGTFPARTSSRDQILAAARRLLKQHGYRRVSMDDIAREAGLAKATLYLHFGGKSAIVRTMFQQCRQEIDSRAVAAAADTDVPSALSGVIEAHLGTAIAWFGQAEHLRELHRLVTDDPESFRIQPLAEMDERLSDILARAVMLGKIAPRRPDAAKVLIAILEDCANGAKQLEAIDASMFAEHVRRAVPVVLDGLFTAVELVDAV